MQKTQISWTNYTSNPIRARHKTTGKMGWACTRLSPGCQRCYAETLNHRWGTKLAYDKSAESEVEWVLVDKELEAVRHHLKPEKIFLGDMTDIFHENVPDAYLLSIFGMIRDAHWHTIQILTKRVERMCQFIGRYAAVYDSQNDVGAYLRDFSHLWVGMSAEDQLRWETRRDWLLRTPASIRFVSFEPLLGPIVGVDGFAPDWDADDYHCWEIPGISWAIIGGESGPRRRPVEIAWIEDLVEQCDDSGIKPWVKQDGALRPGQQGRIPNELWAMKAFPSVWSQYERHSATI